MDTSEGPRDLPAGFTQPRLVGAGAAARVFRVRDELLGRDVALKIYRDRQTDAQARERFLNECHNAARLGAHPGVVSVHSAGVTAADHPWLCMELGTGGSLAQALATGPWEPARALRVMTVVAETLAWALRLDPPMLHRDIKPANILLSGADQPLVADFGIAGSIRNVRSSTNVQAFTQLYAAPEVLHSGRYSAASEAWSLTATLFELVTGRPPFPPVEDEGIGEYIDRVRAGLPAGALPADLPADIAEILRRGLAVDRDERFPDAAALGAALRAAWAATGAPVNDPLPEPAADTLPDPTLDRTYAAETRERNAPAASVPSQGVGEQDSGVGAGGHGVAVPCSGTDGQGMGTAWQSSGERAVDAGLLGGAMGEAGGIGDSGTSAGGSDGALGGSAGAAAGRAAGSDGWGQPAGDTAALAAQTVTAAPKAAAPPRPGSPPTASAAAPSGGGRARRRWPWLVAAVVVVVVAATVIPLTLVGRGSGRGVSAVLAAGEASASIRPPAGTTATATAQPSASASASASTGQSGGGLVPAGAGAPGGLPGGPPPGNLAPVGGSVGGPAGGGSGGGGSAAGGGGSAGGGAGGSASAGGGSAGGGSASGGGGSGGGGSGGSAAGGAAANQPAPTKPFGSMASVRWSWSSSGLYAIDEQVRLDAAGDHTFWNNQFFWPDGSTFGWLGLQKDGNRFDGTVGDLAILSGWNTLGAQGPSCALLKGGERSCRFAYTVTTGRWYRLRLWRGQADATGQWWGAWILDETTGADTYIGSLAVKPSRTLIGGVSSVMQYFGPATTCAGLPTSSSAWTTPAAKGSGDASAPPVTLGFVSGTAPGCDSSATSTAYHGTNGAQLTLSR
jgi:hypothetical protein